MLKDRIYHLLDVTGEGSVSRLCSGFIMALICLNVLAVTLETVDSIEAAYGGFFDLFEKWV